jgi:hypothetical protein
MTKRELVEELKGLHLRSVERLSQDKESHWDQFYVGRASAFSSAISLVEQLDEQLEEPKSGCQCQWEAGDSPCSVHGENEEEP